MPRMTRRRVLRSGSRPGRRVRLCSRRTRQVSTSRSPPYLPQNTHVGDEGTADRKKEVSSGRALTDSICEA